MLCLCRYCILGPYRIFYQMLPFFHLLLCIPNSLEMVSSGGILASTSLFDLGASWGAAVLPFLSVGTLAAFSHRLYLLYRTTSRTDAISPGRERGRLGPAVRIPAEACLQGLALPCTTLNGAPGSTYHTYRLYHSPGLTHRLILDNLYAIFSRLSCCDHFRGLLLWATPSLSVILPFLESGLGLGAEWRKEGDAFLCRHLPTCSFVKNISTYTSIFWPRDGGSLPL